MFSINVLLPVDRAYLGHCKGYCVPGKIYKKTILINSNFENRIMWLIFLEGEQRS